VFRLGEREVVGELPLMGDRGRLKIARRRAQGWTDEDDERLAHAAKMTDADFAEALAKGPSEPLDGDGYAAVAYAAVGLCWPASDALRVPSLRDCRYDVVAYGERVLHHLTVERLAATQREVIDVGLPLLECVLGAIPSQKEVDEARGFSRGGTATSTASTS
jgi:hypothetical protein